MKLGGKRIAVLSALLALTGVLMGCASGAAKRVDCTWQLKPINTPVPAKSTSTPEPPR